MNSFKEHSADQYDVEYRTQTRKSIQWGVMGGILVLLVVILSMVGCPSYNVYKAKKEGEAVLAHAQSSKEVAVADAKAKFESASYLVQADTLRAFGVARSNIIIGTSLKDNEAYLYWLWIDNLEKNQNAVYYIATEGNLPILEAGRAVMKQTPK